MRRLKNIQVDEVEKPMDTETKILGQAQEFMPIYIMDVWEDEREEQKYL